MTRYETGTALKIVEIDNYLKECLPETAQHMEVDIEFKCDTLKDLLDNIADTFDVKSSDIEINACDEPGRIDFNTLENGNGYFANNNEINEWKKGLITLYACNYSYLVEQVTRETVTL